MISNSSLIFIKNFSSLYIANMIIKVGNVFLIVVAARYLGVSNFGQFSFIISFSTLFQTISDMGINFYSIREIARDQKLSSENLSHIITTKIFLGIIAVLALNTFVYFFNYSSQEIIGFRIASVILILDTYIQTFYAMFRSYQKMEFESIALVIEMSLILSFGLFVLFLGKSYLWLLSVYAFAKIVNLFFSGTLLHKKIERITFGFNLNYSKSLVKKSLPFALHILFGLVAFRLDVIFLRIIKDEYFVGLYRATLSITFTIIIFAHMFQASIYPVLSKLFVESKEKLCNVIERSFGLLFYVALFFTIVVHRFADAIILLMFGEQYISSGSILKILILMLPLKFVDQILGITLDAINRQNIRPYLGITFIAVNVIFCIVFINLFSAKGAALAMVLTELISFLLYYYFVSKYLFRVPLSKLAGKGILAAIGTYVSLVFFTPLPFILISIIGFFVYVAILLTLKVQNDIGISAIKSVFAKKSKYCAYGKGDYIKNEYHQRS